MFDGVQGRNNHGFDIAPSLKSKTCAMGVEAGDPISDASSFEGLLELGIKGQICTECIRVPKHSTHFSNQSEKHVTIFSIAFFLLFHIVQRFRSNIICFQNDHRSV